jgi:hypothetical protein
MKKAKDMPYSLNLSLLTNSEFLPKVFWQEMAKIGGKCRQKSRRRSVSQIKSCLSKDIFCAKIMQFLKRSEVMSKSQDTKKDTKKQPTKTLKEKRAAKKEKKATKP